MGQKTKQGAASIFVVIFTTLLLGVITLSFVRIMISEANQTTNYDLSQSAYDSALAGVEDAKVALLKYHECLNQGASGGAGLPGSCEAAIAAVAAADSAENCDIVSDMLERPHKENEETVIQSETNYDEATGATNTMEQAYTCVRITEETDDYLGKLNPSYRTKIIPIRVQTDQLNRVNRLKLEWYNADDRNKAGANNGNSGYAGMGTSGYLTSNKIGYGNDSLFNFANSLFRSEGTAPPTVQMQLIQTNTEFRLSDFNTNYQDMTNQGTLMLKPSLNGVGLVKNTPSVGLAASNDKSFNNPVDVRCDPDIRGAYACSVDIALPKPYIANVGRNDGTMFIRLALPYSEPETSFSLKMYACPDGNSGSNCDLVQFAGVQAKVDSTGRANDLFRRVESRVELVDTYFPYPEFTADLNGGGDDSIWKNYWVTKNCWTTGPGYTPNGVPCDWSGPM